MAFLAQHSPQKQPHHDAAPLLSEDELKRLQRHPALVSLQQRPTWNEWQTTVAPHVRARTLPAQVLNKKVYNAFVATLQPPEAATTSKLATDAWVLGLENPLPWSRWLALAPSSTSVPLPQNQKLHLAVYKATMAARFGPTWQSILPPRTRRPPCFACQNLLRVIIQKLHLHLTIKLKTDTYTRNMNDWFLVPTAITLALKLLSVLLYIVNTQAPIPYFSRQLLQKSSIEADYLNSQTQLALSTPNLPPRSFHALKAVASSCAKLRAHLQELHETSKQPRTRKRGHPPCAASLRNLRPRKPQQVSA